VRAAAAGRAQADAARTVTSGLVADLADGSPGLSRAPAEGARESAPRGNVMPVEAWAKAIAADALYAAT